MIIKGKSRGLPQNLGTYLTENEENERAEVIEVRGTIAQDVPGALKEMDALASGTKCELPLYHAQISPEPPYRLNHAQRMTAVDSLEKRLGLEGHPRVVVVHEKKDREHLHVVWGRVNPNTLEVVSMSFNYRKNEEVARELERQFGHPRVQGAHAEREGAERPDRSPSRSELRQEERTGIKGAHVKAEVTAAFRASDSAEAFKTTLEGKDYMLAKGDRRDFVIVDRAGGIHSLARRIDGIKAAELREFMEPVDREALPSASTARDAQIDRSEGRRSAIDERTWDEKLSESAIAKEKLREQAEREAAKQFRADSIKWEAEQKRLRVHRKESRAKAKREKAYGRGDGYANQSTAALQDHKKRQRALNKAPKPIHPSDHRSPTVQNDFRDNSQSATSHSPNQPVGNLPDPNKDRPHGPTIDGHDYNDAADKRYNAMKITLYGEGGFEKSYFADEARLRHEVAREREQNNAEHRAPSETSFGPDEKRHDFNAASDARYKAMRITLYGENGFEKSYFADEVRLRHEEAEERKREEAKNQRPIAKPLGENKQGRSVWESDEETRNRMQRLLNEEKWEPRSDDEDLEPDRQHKAPGGGRTRSR